MRTLRINLQLNSTIDIGQIVQKLWSNTLLLYRSVVKSMYLSHLFGRFLTYQALKLPDFKIYCDRAGFCESLEVQLKFPSTDLGLGRERGFGPQ